MLLNSINLMLLSTYYMFTTKFKSFIVPKSGEALASLLSMMPLTTTYTITIVAKGSISSQVSSL